MRVSLTVKSKAINRKKCMPIIVHKIKEGRNGIIFCFADF